jgi:hypothetical protein
MRISLFLGVFMFSFAAVSLAQDKTSNDRASRCSPSFHYRQ